MHIYELAIAQFLRHQKLNNTNPKSTKTLRFTDGTKGKDTGSEETQKESAVVDKGEGRTDEAPGLVNRRSESAKDRKRAKKRKRRAIGIDERRRKKNDWEKGKYESVDFSKFVDNEQTQRIFRDVYVDLIVKSRKYRELKRIFKAIITTSKEIEALFVKAGLLTPYALLSATWVNTRSHSNVIVCQSSYFRVSTEM